VDDILGNRLRKKKTPLERVDPEPEVDETKADKEGQKIWIEDF